MFRKEINLEDLILCPTDIWLKKWFLLTAGNKENYNMMTVAWGSIGGMWQKPIIQVVAKPCRYTFKFLEKYKTFSLSSFPQEYKDDLWYLGTNTGESQNKIEGTKLTPQQSKQIETPAYKEANLVFECSIIYYQDLNRENFLDENIERFYPENYYHRIYFGQILQVDASTEFIKTNNN